MVCRLNVDSFAVHDMSIFDFLEFVFLEKLFTTSVLLFVYFLLLFSLLGKNKKPLCIIFTLCINASTSLTKGDGIEFFLVFPFFFLLSNH